MHNLGMKSQNTILRRRRAVSPVIATVILVAVTITVAVAVSYWMSGISSQYTSFEKVEIKSGYSSRKEDSNKFMGWVIEMELQNTGSSTATLETVFINDRPIIDYGVSTVITGLEKIRWLDYTSEPTDTWTGWDSIDTLLSGVSLESGDEDKVYLLIYGDKTVDPGPDTIPGTADDIISDGLFSAGTTLNVKLHSASGMDYIKLVQLS